MRSLPAACAAVACLVLASGCASKDDAPTTAPSGESPSSTSTSVATDTPGATASTTTSATDAPPTETPLVDRLLPTRLVPGLNAQWRWQDGETGPAGTEQFGVCAKADLASIGAVSAYERSYFPPDDSDDSAAEQVAEFPDAATAARAWSVLESWYAHCKQKGRDHPGLVVSKLIDLPGAGAARWYLLSWTPAGEETGRFEAFGMALSGTRIAVVRMDNSGDDHNYPHEPIAEMVAAAAGALD